MSNPAVESKSAKKRKTKVEANLNVPTGGRASPTADSGVNGSAVGESESPILKELTKNIRNLHKKLSASAKADAVVKDNPDVSLDDLVAQKKLNNDQRAQLLKKPQVQAQLDQLEEQQKHYQKFSQELEEKFNKEKSTIAETHEQELTKAKEDAATEASKLQAIKVEQSLTVVTGFLHAAAAMRQNEDQSTEEARAFEGALLLVYQGNEASLNALKSLVAGSDEKVPDTEGNVLDFTYSQIKDAALKDVGSLVEGPDSAETIPEAVVEEIAEATTVSDDIQIQTDPTVANAGLTELEDTNTIATITNGTTDEEPTVAPEQASTGDDAANAAAESSWDPQASITSAQTGTGEDWVQVPRDPAETETGSSAPTAQQSTSNWADEAGAAAAVSTDDTTAVAVTPENDGFEQVRRDRGGRGRGGHGEFRGHRGEGRGGRGYEGRGGRGRGGRGGRGERGEFRGHRGEGRGGRGGGHRGDRAPQASPAVSTPVATQT